MFVALCDSPEHGHADAAKQVSLAVLTCASLEEPLGERGGFRVSEEFEFSLYVFGFGHYRLPVSSVVEEIVT